MRLLATLSCIGVLLAAPAWAQGENPASKTPGTAPDQPNQADRLFIREAAISGMAEVEFGKMAEQKGQAEAVKGFARRMVEDHTKANDRLMSLATQDGIALPHELDSEHTAMRERLEQLSGAEFDRAYLQGQIADHQKAVQLLEWEIGSAQDTELKSFASEALPVVLEHLQLAQGIQAEMTGKVP